MVVAIIAFFFMGALPVLASGQQPYQEAEILNGGKISGMVRFSGPKPQQRTVRVSKDQEFCGKTMPADELVVSDNGAIRHMVVGLEGITKGKKTVRSVVIIDNKNCMFEPHVQAAVTGAPVEMRSSDPVFHNVHALLDGKRTLFNLALPIQGQKILRRLGTKPGVIELMCDAHLWMLGYLRLFDHPYFAVTNAEGFFEITDVPPGRYWVVSWQEHLNGQKKEVLVTPGAEVKVELLFTPADLREGEASPHHGQVMVEEGPEEHKGH